MATQEAAPGTVRLAGLRDVGALVRLYRTQLDEPRRWVTPFPFDRPRLTIVFTGLILARPVLGLVRRIRPGWAHWVLVAESSGVVVGVGFVHLARANDRRWIGRTGLLVAPPERGKGWGTRLKRAQILLCDRERIERIQAYLQGGNAASRRVNERLGLQIRPSGPDDPVRPVGPYLIAEGDVRRLAAALEEGAAHR